MIKALRLLRCLFSFAYINEGGLTCATRNVGKNGKELFISNYPILKKKTIIQPTLFNEYEKMIENTAENMAV